MGNLYCLSDRTTDVFVYVKTGDRKHASTDANVRIILHDDAGSKSEEITLDNFLRDDFRKGANDTFRVRNLKKFGRVEWIEFWRDNVGVSPDWYVERIMVENVNTNDMSVFPVFRWIKVNYHYKIKHLDTSLPQFDEQRDQRRMEIEEKKEKYQFSSKSPGMPVMCLVQPEDERFSFDYQWNILKMKAQLIATSKIVKFMTGDWESLAHLKNIYTKTVFTVPLSLQSWQNDLMFGLQRVMSCNPTIIELCTSLPDKLGVDEDMLRPFLEGLSLQNAIEAKRLFYTDMDILKDLPTRGEEYKLCAPIALFFLNGNKQLIPIAIQLYQDKSSDNLVFLPSDPPCTWTLAKMWYNNADATFHQSLTHLGFTHLLMEGVAMVTHRNMSQSHPIFKLLGPHFLYLIAINARGVSLLISEGGWVDSTMNTGIVGMFELIKRGVLRWRMDVHGTLPEDLKQRGVYSSDVLPFYPFRDDALLFYEAINNYVRKYVNMYYDTPEKLTEDWELQSWAEELSRAKDKGGAGILGVHGNGSFTNKNDLISVLTSIIYTCSVGHAAANFPQYDEYGFPANYPGLLRGQPPTDKLQREEKDILQALPDKPTTLDIMVVTKLLSSRGTKSLGDFEMQYIFDPGAKKIVKEFRKELKTIQNTIVERNKTRHPKYHHLEPDAVPNSISI